MIRFRGTRSRDIRAPNLFDLYRTNGTTFSNGNFDFLTNRSLTATGGLSANVNGGNPNLKPEKADTLTAGVVFKPLSKLTLAVDYYDIKVRDFITTLNGVDQLFQQACYDSGGTSFYCTLQERPGGFSRTPANQAASNAATKWFSLPANVASLSTYGVDVEANFQTTIDGDPFSLRGLVSYQPHVRFNQPGAKPQDFASALGTPVAYATSAKLRMSLYAHYKPTANLSLDWQTRFRGKMHQSPDPTLLEEKNAGAPAVAYSNASVSYALPGPFDGKAVIYLNVQNVFDTKAPVASYYTIATSPGIGGGFVLGDDPIGRYYRVGVRFRW